ncbi:MAG: ABC transporter ATP-binding protein [Candidatus Zixiibacteriota bacterium]
MIALDQISYQYAKSTRPALHELSLMSEPGCIFTLLGPNGAGKTTLLRIVSGLIVPQAGSVTVCDHDMRTREYQARACIGLVLGEERSFYYRLSGAQNLEFFGGLYGIPRHALTERIGRLLVLVGLEGDAKLQYMRYSNGMKKRLALARALLHDPPVLLLDEPNSGIDPASARTIREILTEQKDRGKTILLTTHDMTEAERLSDQIGFLKEGKLLMVGTLAEFQGLSKKTRFEIDFCRTSDFSANRLNTLAERIRSVSDLHTIDATDTRLVITSNGSFDMGAVLKEVTDSGLAIVRANTCTASLEDVFIQLAG